jgi:hypothetical protein
MNALEGALTLLSGVTIVASAPFLPALAELFNQKDAGELHIAQDYVKDPRFFANSFRRKLEPLLAQAGEDLPYKSQIQLRKAEDLLIDRELILASKTGFRGIAISLGGARFANDSGSHDLWIRGQAEIGERFRCWTLAVDGDLDLGAGCRIKRWVDSGGTAVVGPGTQLGQSASAAELLLLHDRVTFQRLYAQPIVVVSTEENRGLAPPKVDDPLIDDHAFTDDNGLCFPHGCTIDHDIICSGNVRIGTGVRVTATIKAHGKVTILSGTTVDGNVISRAGIEIGDDCSITGNVFAEGDVTIGKHVTVGTAEAHKSVYSAGKVLLHPGVRVHGAIVAERGGTVA